MNPPGDTTVIPLNLELRLLPSHFGLLMLLNQQAKKEVMMLAKVTDSDYQGGNWTGTPQWRYVWNAKAFTMPCD